MQHSNVLVYVYFTIDVSYLYVFRYTQCACIVLCYYD